MHENECIELDCSGILPCIYYRVERGLQGLPSSRGVEHMARSGSVDGFENCEKEVKM